MRITYKLLILFFVFPSIGYSIGPPASLNLPPFGQVSIFEPVGAHSGLIIFFPDPATIESVPKSSLEALVQAGQVVAVVNTKIYIDNLNLEKSECIRASDDCSALKKLLFHQYKLQENIFTVLAGVGSGGGLAYAVLAQSEGGQFSGAIAFQFNPEIPGNHPLCPGAPTIKTPIGYRYLPLSPLNGFLRLMTVTPDDKRLHPYASIQKNTIFPLRPYDDLSSGIISVIEDISNAPSSISQNIDRLPIVLLPVKVQAKRMAIIYSGDGGWRDLDKQIGEELQRSGVPVVGVDTLRYFWKKKSPEVAAQDLETIMNHFISVWNAPDVLLIGYSFGADVLPFLINRINPSLQKNIRLISLLGLSRTTDFEIHMSGWFGGTSSKESLPVAPETRKLDCRKIQCFFGIEEQDESGCVDTSLHCAQIIKTPGGHHFDGDYRKIARTIVEGAVRNSAEMIKGESKEVNRK